MKKVDPMNKLIPDAPPTEKASLGEVVPAQRAENLIRTFFERPGWTILEDCIKATVKTAWVTPVTGERRQATACNGAENIYSYVIRHSSSWSILVELKHE